MEFLVLPDIPSAAVTARNSLSVLPRSIPHASGRPWLAGAWLPADLTLVTAGDRKLALLGATRADPAELTRVLANAGTPHDLDAVCRRLPGCVHVAASFDGVTRTQGSISTARQVFSAVVNGRTFAAGSPGPLLPLTGGEIDEEILALQLLLPAPWPLSLRPVWRGLRAVQSAHWLEIPADGVGAREVRWWIPPEPVVPLSTGAATIAAALADSVAVRAAAGPISADLSGGLDSTSLAFLAAATGAEVTTHHWQPRDAGNPDTRWAREAAARMPGARHRIWLPEESPSWYDATADPDAVTDDVDGPLGLTRNRAHMQQLVRAAAQEGATAHLIGVGGDELFGVAPLYPWSLIRRNPLRGLRLARRFQTVNRWGLAATVRHLADRGSFARALRRYADELEAPMPPRFHPPTGWGRGDPRMPSWATPEAVQAVRRLLREAAAAGTEPLDRDRLQHQTLEVTVLSGQGVRQLSTALRRCGVPLETPFLDDRVVEAALSIRLPDRVSPGRYKPVLVEAMRGTVPAPVLDRKDKGSFGQEAYEGLYRNRGRLGEMCDDLRLARRGLVDSERLRRALGSPMPDTRQLTPFENTLACETWLRSPSAGPPAATATTTTRGSR
jgi:asparagine synthase (glutamine-hydrolysing)